VARHDFEDHELGDGFWQKYNQGQRFWVVREADAMHYWAKQDSAEELPEAKVRKDELELEPPPAAPNVAPNVEDLGGRLNPAWKKENDNAAAAAVESQRERQRGERARRGTEQRAPRAADKCRAQAVRQRLAEMGFAGADADAALLRACDYDLARVLDRLVEQGAAAAWSPPAPGPTPPTPKAGAPEGRGRGALAGAVDGPGQMLMHLMGTGGCVMAGGGESMDIRPRKISVGGGYDGLWSLSTSLPGNGKTREGGPSRDSGRCTESERDDQNLRAQKRSKTAGEVEANLPQHGGGRLQDSSDVLVTGESRIDDSRSNREKGGGGAPYRPNFGDGPRVALCIGNNNYPGKILPNCVADAEDMGACCEQLGFARDKIIVLKDANKLAIMQAVRTMRNEHIKDGSLVLFFFSGHGVEYGGVNYLLPLGMTSDNKEDLPEEGVSVDVIMRIFSTPTSAVNVFLLDCCREDDLNVTFKSKGYANTGTKGMGKNFRSSSKNAEFLVGLACDPGTLALPNEASRNSRYTAALLKHLPVKGRDLLMSMREVTADVFRDTQKKQRPWFESCLMRGVVLDP
jgi:hypothetical protein